MKKLMYAVFLVVLMAAYASAQSTAFTYQGRLLDNGTAPTGNYDFEFSLWDASSVGNQRGSTVTLTNVLVSSGIFTVNLDFGIEFPGSARFLEISVRQAGIPPYTPLAPRQPISSAPYAIKSLNSDTATDAQSLGGVVANQYVLTGDARMSDARTPTAGSANYIQNQNAAPQSSSNFNISGNGTVGGTVSGNEVNANSYYSIRGSNILSIDGSSNFFAGQNVSNAGSANTMVGFQAGLRNTGSFNTFVGMAAGAGNTTGNKNSIFGWFAGSDYTGDNNAIFGSHAGYSATAITTNGNSFFGSYAGGGATNNTSIGFRASNTGFGSASLINATAIGSYSAVSQNHSLILGSIDGVNSCSAAVNCASVNVGIGTTAPADRLHVSGSGAVRVRINSDSNTGLNLTINNNPGWSVASANGGNFLIFNDALVQSAFGIDAATNVITINSLGSAGGSQLCRNASNQISNCSSSLRYKTNIGRFSQGMAFVNMLRPITFDWKDGGKNDVGFGAEDIAKIDPRFVTYNKDGEVEGVKYDRLSVAFVNAFKEQQSEFAAQRKQMDNQQLQIETLFNKMKVLEAENTKLRSEIQALKHNKKTKSRLHSK